MINYLDKYFPHINAALAGVMVGLAYFSYNAGFEPWGLIRFPAGMSFGAALWNAAERWL